MTSVSDLTHRVKRIDGLEAVVLAHGAGILQRWGALLPLDPFATSYQGPEWCINFYASYVDEYEPLVLAVLGNDGELVGVVPLCLKRSDRSLHFAGAAFADYRDVLAKPEHRERALQELLQLYRDVNASNVFRIGPMSPGSPSVDLIASLARQLSVDCIARHHSGWRYLEEHASADNHPLKNKTLKYNYNWYKRNGGTIDIEVVTERAQWEQLRAVFLEQHSMRQLSAGRELSFTDPRKVKLFDLMFASESGHFCVLRASGRIIATHFGFRTGGLLHWGAPAFNIRDAARSPSLLLLAIILMDLNRWGLTGLDFTIGEGFLKERYSNIQVSLPSVDLYPTALSYRKALLRTHASERIKERPDLYSRLKKVGALANRTKSVLHKHGLSGAAEITGRVLRERVWSSQKGLVLTVTPETLRSMTTANESCLEHGVDRFEDLLLWDGADQMTQYMLSQTAQGIIASRKAGRILHTLTYGGLLACLGYSYLPEAPALMTEVGSLELQFDSGAASLYAFYTVPEFRGRGLYQALLNRILEWHFKAGVKLAYITVLENNVPSLSAIEKIGFKRIQRNEVRRIGSVVRVKRTDLT